MQRPSVFFILDTRSALRSGVHTGKYPIKLRVTFTVYVSRVKKWIQKYYATDRYVSEEEYKSITGNPRLSELKLIRKAMFEMESKALGVIDTIEDCSVAVFEHHFLNEGNFESVAGVFDKYVAALRIGDKEGTAMSYANAKNSLVTYGGEFLTFQEITPEWLKAYEKAMLKKERSVATIGIYLRSLRAVFNYAMAKQIVKADVYPFGKGKYRIPTSVKSKDALSEVDKNRLLNYNPEGLEVARGLGFWKLSYYCNGMNFSDVAHLRWRDIDGDVLRYQRQKTGNTERVKKAIEVPLRKEVKEFIYKHGLPSLVPDAFVFDIINDSMSTRQKKIRIADWLKKTNAVLKILGNDLKLPFKVTTYTARHTFATISLRKGASIEQIQEALGHSSVNTTQVYLSGFDFESKKAMSDRL